jgi:hypothetical protein
MNQLPILMHMADVVVNYIYQMKGVRINLRIGEIITSEDQVNKLIDAFNHIKKQGQYGG